MSNITEIFIIQYFHFSNFMHQVTLKICKFKKMKMRFIDTFFIYFLKDAIRSESLD